MQHLLQDIVVSNIFAFLLIFSRLGTALMVMPGIGDTFVSMQVRLLFALAFSFVLMPFLSHGMPAPPADAFPFAMLVISEAVIGIFIGTIMRIMITALDTAGSIASLQIGLSNSTIFNPATATQGSMTGALYSMFGVALILSTDMHHAMLASVVDSYKTFPANGHIPGVEAMAQTIGKTVAAAFRIGIQMSMPFLVVGTLIQVGFGLLGRLMPQIQVFFLALPAQIFIGLLLFAMTLSVGMMYWLNGFDSVVSQALLPQ
jgi:flagellar biosynthetic protein FliR